MSEEHIEKFEKLLKIFDERNKETHEKNEAVLRALIASNSSDNQIVMYKLDQMEINQNNIFKKVSETNGSVARVIVEQAELKKEQELLKQDQDHKLQTHTISCSGVKSVEERVVKLENENITKSGMRKLMYQGVGLLATIGTIITVIYKLMGGS